MRNAQSAWVAALLLGVVAGIAGLVMALVGLLLTLVVFRGERPA